MKRDDDEKKQKKFRWEFFKRSKAYQDYNDGKIGRLIRAFPNFRIFRPLISKIEELKDGKDAFLNELRKVVAGVPSIEVIYGMPKGVKSVALNYLARNDEYFRSIDNWIKQHPDQFRKRARFFSLLNAVNKEDKTIHIKIHLNRKKENIRKDFTQLLDFIEKEAKYRKFNLKRPKPHWDEYEKYIQTWDLREKEQKKWSDIAREVLPKYFQGKPQPEAAISLVKHYYRQAKIMGNGKWRQL